MYPASGIHQTTIVLWLCVALSVSVGYSPSETAADGNPACFISYISTVSTSTSSYSRAFMAKTVRDTAHVAMLQRGPSYG